MKKKFLRNILACVMAFSLTAADVAPVFAAETQSADVIAQEADAVPEEDARETKDAETEVMAPVQTDAAAPLAGEDQAAEDGSTADTTAAPSITQSELSEQEYGNRIIFQLNYTATDADGCELTVTANNQTVYTNLNYRSGTKIDSDKFNYSLTPDVKYTFTLKPFANGTDNNKVYGEAKSAEWTMPAPAVSVPALSATRHSSDVLFRLNFELTNADCCSLAVTANNVTVYSDSDYSSNSSIDSGNFSGDLVSGARYAFTLTPYKNGVAGTPKSAIWTAPAVPAVTGLAVKEMTPNGFVFSHGALPSDASVYYEYADNAAFTDSESASGESLGYYNLDAGVTYYVRAYARLYGMKGGYSNVITVTAPVAEVTSIATEITNTSVTLTMHAGYGDYTGFEVSRKIGKKYQKLTTTADNMFEDAGLENETAYQYRIRAVCYNINTKKTSYGDYAYKTVTTGNAAFNLKAEAKGKNKIQLKWAKIAGAAGYDVYRSEGYSSSRTYKSGEDYDFSKYELVKSLGKKKKSYTDKKLTAGESYSYIIKAYKTVKGKKQYFAQAQASASTKFSFSTSVNIYKRAQNPKNGTVEIAWKQIPQAGGYLIEKEDSVTGNWVTLAKLGVGKTKYTLPAAPAGKTVEYRVRAYKGNKYSGAASVDVTGHIAVVTGVKATPVANGIQVSWAAVPGASYYRVYRTTSSATGYNEDLKTYEYDNEREVEPRAFKAASGTATNYYYTVGTSAVKMERDYEAENRMSYHHPSGGYYDAVAGTSIVDYSCASHNIVAAKDNVTLYGPQAGVTYNYYVVAYSVQRDTSDTSSVSYLKAESYGNSKAASAVYAGSVAKLKAPTVKAKAGKKKATLTIKKVSGASGYAVYRSEKKNGAYRLVGVTTKTKFTDSGLTAKKKYFYKVKAVGKSSIGTDFYSAFSKVKNIKAK